MNSYDFAASNGITGTDAEVVAVLQSMSQSNIARDRLGPWLGQETELLYYSGNSWIGTLEDMIQAGQITGDLLAGVNLLKAVVVGSAANHLRTSEPDHAPRIYATIQGIAAITPDDDDALIDGFYSLDGGRPFASLTVDQFAADRSDSQRLARADQYAAQLDNEYIAAAVADPARTAETIHAAYQSAAAVPVPAGSN
jgi:hypothetical protein